MSAHVLLNLLNKFGKRDKMRGLLVVYRFYCLRLFLCQDKGYFQKASILKCQQMP